MTFQARRGLAIALVATFFGTSAVAETPEEWVKLGARVHGGFGAFIPVGIKIGLDAAQTLKAQPRQLSVTYYDNPKSPCACFADGIAIATVASVGQRTVTIAPEKAPDDAAAVVVIRPRTGGQGLRYVIPMRALPKLAEMNKTLEPLQRYHAVMKADGLFTRSVEP
ncbi:MAG: FmdE family protein [Beijerinckiaceae bacterium]